MNKFNFLSGCIGQWQLHKRGSFKIWLAGYDNEKNLDVIIDLISKFNSINVINCRKIVSNLGEHFGIIIISPKWVFAAVDYTRGYPLYWKQSEDKLYVSPQANLIKEKKISSIDNKQLTAFRMSGYTINQGTIWKNINNLSTGSYIFFNQKGKLLIKRYFSYFPSPSFEKQYFNVQTKLKDQLKKIIKKIILDAKGKTIIVPLSAGLDSRFIASGLKHYNYLNVKCFSYGHKNNYEALASKKIANKLGFEWTFVEIRQKPIKNFYSSDIYKKYIKFSADGCATSTIQGFYAINLLLKSKYIKKDNIIINGNSGDFISGGHIPKELLNLKYKSNNYKNLFNKVFHYHYEKHYSLWDSLKISKNKKIIKEQLFNQIKEVIKKKEITAYAILEFLEYENRQSKYVINSQRIYDYYKLSWLLPLWNKSFVKFWEKVPLQYKLNQNLYRDTLKKINYGGVWTNNYYFPFKVSSIKMRFIRFFFKSFFFFVGKKKWYKFEKKYLNYWTENIYGFSSIKYFKVIKNKNGARNYVSWYTLFAEKNNTGRHWQEN